jgi:hypothetical protein
VVEADDLRDRVAGGEDATQAAGHQAVPDLEVGIGGQVAQGQGRRIPSPEGESPYAGALDLHRDLMLGIGDQENLGAPGADVGGLA